MRRYAPLCLFVCLVLVAGCQLPGSVAAIDHDAAAAMPDAAGGEARKLDTSELSSKQSAEVNLATAVELEANGFEDEAIAAYQRALTFDPGCRGVNHRLARLHARAGQPELAGRYFQSALQETPRDAELLADYGYFLYEQGDASNAEQTLRSALQIDPNSQRTLGNLAIVLAATDRVAESLQLFEQSVGPAAARFNLAVLLARSGRTAESEQMLQQASSLDPHLPQAKAFRTWLAAGSTGAPETEEPYAGSAMLTSW